MMTAAVRSTITFCTPSPRFNVCYSKRRPRIRGAVLPQRRNLNPGSGREFMGNVWSSIQLGEPQVFRNVVILPIAAADTSTLDYLTLEEALRSAQLRIEEISHSGSVP